MTASFSITGILLGIGLAMDAFSVSMANGLNEPNMPKRKAVAIAGVFSGFQFLMPMIGWACVHTMAEYFTVFQLFIPWIALGLLAYIGIKMIREGRQEEGSTQAALKLGASVLIMQGVATSIDALSVGFAIADYDLMAATGTSIIIMVETFVISIIGVRLGRVFGTKFAGKASILGGIVLIGIGLEIFISNVFFS